MPNTNPVIDNVSIVDFLKRRGREKSKINIYPTASILPFSPIINPPISAKELCGSIIFALIKYLFFIYSQKIFKQAILTATPNSTCSFITLLFISSAKFVSISIPLFIGPGCIIKASSLAY